MPLPVPFRLAALLDGEYHLTSHAQIRQGKALTKSNSPALSEAFQASIARIEELQAGSTITNAANGLPSAKALITDSDGLETNRAKLAAWVTEVTAGGQTHYATIAATVVRKRAEDPEFEARWNASLDRHGLTHPELRRMFNEALKTLALYAPPHARP